MIAGATLVGVLTLGAVLGGLGVWTLSQETAETRAWVRDPVSLPQVVALRTLDPDAIVKEPVSILAAWAPPRSSENTFDEKAMFWATPMSHFESVHFRPERL